MPLLKYRFHGIVPDESVVILEKLPNFQLFGRPRGQQFEATERDCEVMLEDAAWYHTNRHGEPNAENNMAEMTKALHAIQAFKLQQGLAEIDRTAPESCRPWIRLAPIPYWISGAISTRE